MKFRIKTFFPPILLMWMAYSCHAENKVINLNITQDSKTITVSPHLDFSTSQEIKEAIDNGIRVQLIAKSELYQPVSWWFDKSIDKDMIRLEISYYVLGKYYVVTNKKTNQRIGNIAYNKLWTDIEKLIVMEFSNPGNNESWVKLRIMLDKGSLPTAMQLPVLFNENWDIDTEWFAQQVKLSD